jgi:hypothetical protein
VKELREPQGIQFLHISVAVILQSLVAIVWPASAVNFDSTDPLFYGDVRRLVALPLGLLTLPLTVGTRRTAIELSFAFPPSPATEDRRPLPWRLLVGLRASSVSLEDGDMSRDLDLV